MSFKCIKLSSTVITNNIRSPVTIVTKHCYDMWRTTEWLVLVLVLMSTIIGATANDDLSATMKLLQEKVNALLDHRQEEYNALEISLKRAMEKNTELIVLKNEVKQLRYVN